jgi:hypothetical protein
MGGLSRCSLLKCLAYLLLVSHIVNELLMRRNSVCVFMYVVLDRLLLCTSVFYRSHTVVASLYFDGLQLCYLKDKDALDFTFSKREIVEGIKERKQ